MGSKHSTNKNVNKCDNVTALPPLWIFVLSVFSVGVSIQQTNANAHSQQLTTVYECANMPFNAGHQSDSTLSCIYVYIKAIYIGNMQQFLETFPNEDNQETEHCSHFVSVGVNSEWPRLCSDECCQSFTWKLTEIYILVILVDLFCTASPFPLIFNLGNKHPLNKALNQYDNETTPIHRQLRLLRYSWSVSSCTSRRDKGVLLSTDTEMESRQECTGVCYKASYGKHQTEELR